MDGDQIDTSWSKLSSSIPMQSKPLNVHDFTCQLIIQKSLWLLKTWQLDIQKHFDYCWRLPDPPLHGLCGNALQQWGWNTGRETFAQLQTGHLWRYVWKKVFGLLDKCINIFCTPPWLVLFSLLSRLDFSIFDWILAWIYVFPKYWLKTQGFLTPGFFIPLSEVCVEADVSSSLLGSCELLQPPSSTSCSRIALFLHSEVPVCKYWTSGRK